MCPNYNTLFTPRCYKSLPYRTTSDNIIQQNSHTRALPFYTQTGPDQPLGSSERTPHTIFGHVRTIQPLQPVQQKWSKITEITSLDAHSPATRPLQAHDRRYSSLANNVYRHTYRGNYVISHYPIFPLT